MLLRLLTGNKRNICCVEDEDQSIYGWRGAQLKNILNFDKDFADAKIISWSKIIDLREIFLNSIFINFRE